MRIKHYVMLMLFFAASFPVLAQNTECSGTETATADGIPFVNGYTYAFSTSGDVVTATFQLLDPQVGLVAFAQTYNPNFAETPMNAVGDPASQTFTLDFPGFSDGETFSIAVKFAYAGGLSTGEILEYTVGEDCGIITPDQVDLPVTFDDPNVDYAILDFEGNSTTLVADPGDAGNTVAQTVKTDGAQTFAGTIVGEPDGLANPVPFDAENTGMSVRVWSPASGIPVRMKLEEAGNPAVGVEAEVLTTTSASWETLIFDFANSVPATPPINLNNTYNKVILFFDFGSEGDDATYLWENVQFEPGVGGLNQIDLPITFEDTEADYGLTDFGGNASTLVADPEDAGNTVVQSIRTAGAEVFAGTTVGQPLGLENPIPFDFDNTQLSVRVWSPAAGVPVRLKVEDVADGAIFVETEVLTTAAASWETLTFNFAEPVAGALDLNNQYNLVTIFFNFGLAAGPEQTYFWDDVEFAPGGGFTEISLPLTFDETEYTLGLNDFGGNVSSIVPDPEDANNNVVQSIRTAGAAVFAGTSVPGQGLTTPIPFEEGSTTMNMRVWSPASGIPVLFKVENSNNTISSEVSVNTTTSGEWETMVFDLSNSLTAPLDFNVDYVRVSIFFNFGLEGGSEEIYFWDDVAFGDGTVPCAQPYPPMDESSLSLVQNPNGSLSFTWDGIPGQIGCVVNVKVGDINNPIQQTTFIRSPENNFLNAPAAQLMPFTTYNFRVRCGCQQFPFIIANQFTDYVSIVTGIGIGEQENNTDLSDWGQPNPELSHLWLTNPIINGTTGETEMLLGYESNVKESSLRTFPNPSEGQVTLQYRSADEGQAILRVFDALGKLVHAENFGVVKGTATMELDLSQFESGIYTVEVLKGEDRVTNRVMLK